WNWNETDNELEMYHIGIRGEAGSGKIDFNCYCTLHLKKIAHIFDNNEKNKNNDQWLKIMNELNIPQWITDDTDIVYLNNGLLILDEFDEIANELIRDD
ncbi:hypothetical protein RFI_22696, partial [Reticulomyxa filosa]